MLTFGDFQALWRSVLIVWCTTLVMSSVAVIHLPDMTTVVFFFFLIASSSTTFFSQRIADSKDDTLSVINKKEHHSIHA